MAKLERRKRRAWRRHSRFYLLKLARWVAELEAVEGRLTSAARTACDEARTALTSELLTVSGRVAARGSALIGTSFDQEERAAVVFIHARRKQPTRAPLDAIAPASCDPLVLRANRLRGANAQTRATIVRETFAPVLEHLRDRRSNDATR